MMAAAVMAALKCPAGEQAEIMRIWERLEKANAPCEARAKLARFSRLYWWTLEKRELGVLSSL